MKRIIILSLLFIATYAASQTQGLPAGFTLTQSGLVCMGTGNVCNPTATIPLSDVGNYVFNTVACDANGNCSGGYTLVNGVVTCPQGSTCTPTQISLSIGANCQVTITPTSLPQGMVGKVYAQKLTPNGTGCTAPFVFSLQ